MLSLISFVALCVVGLSWVHEVDSFHHNTLQPRSWRNHLTQPHSTPVQSTITAPEADIIGGLTVTKVVEVNKEEIWALDLGVLEDINPSLKKYALKLEISPESLQNEYDKYIAVLKKKKIQFNGFQPGKMPPSAKRDVYRFVVDYCTENIFNRISSALEADIYMDSSCKSGVQPNFDTLILPDADGKRYTERRDEWRLGSPFAFTTVFYGQLREPPVSPITP